MKNHTNQGKDVMEAADEFVSEAAQAGDEVWKNGEVAVESAEKAVNQRWEAFVSTAKKQSKASQTAISKSPFRSIAIALGAGLVLGALLSPRR